MDCLDVLCSSMLMQCLPTFRHIPGMLYQTLAHHPMLLGSCAHSGTRLIVPSLPVQAQFGEEASKPAKPEKVVGDVNAIPLGERPKQEQKKPAIELDAIPDVEWWDARFLKNPKVRLCSQYPCQGIAYWIIENSLRSSSKLTTASATPTQSVHVKVHCAVDVHVGL